MGQLWPLKLCSIPIVDSPYQQPGSAVLWNITKDRVEMVVDLHAERQQAVAHQAMQQYAPALRELADS